MNPLDQLRDIHAAPTPHWWPPAPGWWFLAALILVLIYFLVRWTVAQWRRRQQRRAILQQFNAVLPAFDEHGDRRQLAMELDVLMRRLALLRFPREKASLVGDEWLQLWGVEAQDPMARLLTQAPYQAAPNFDPAQLHAWVVERVKVHA